MYTFHAPAERSLEEEIHNQSEALIKHAPQLKTFLDAAPEVYLILNDKRQIVFANKAVCDLLKIGDKHLVYGQRIGEILGCAQAFETEGGCGTTETCRTCGACNAILTSLNQKSDIQECRLTNKNTGDAMDFRVWTTPHLIDDKIYSIFAVSDISHEKRRAALERIFFHDILNTAGGLRGIANILNEPNKDKDEHEEYLKYIYQLSDKLIEEINAQRQLMQAESNELKPVPIETNSNSIIGCIYNLYKAHELIGTRTLKISEDTESIDLVIDETLALRVIGNMVKNAIEAAGKIDTITFGAFKENNKICFWVHNPTYMPRGSQLQVFKRSFSTKGSGRGLGTYSMKLLSERYLKGRVWFETSETIGTTFYAEYPLNANG